MNIVINPGSLGGTVQAPPSKSMLHRLLICASFADKPTTLHFSEISKDIAATMGALEVLGARMICEKDRVTVYPVEEKPATAVIHCGQSASTLRFLLPVVGALGVDCTFHMDGRLSDRPLSPLWEEMERMGCRLCRETKTTVRCHGQLHAGEYSIDGGLSSQFVTGLMLGLNLLPQESRLNITGKASSKSYIQITRSVLRLFGIHPQQLGTQKFCSPGHVVVEGDWSNGAFFLAANALGNNLRITGLSPDSVQGDRAVVAILKQMEGATPTIASEDIPDLVPILSVVAACKQGAVFTGIARLRLKESDRVAAICHMLNALGGKAEATQDTLTVFPSNFTGGTVDTRGDHRIAMAAAIAATRANGPVRILSAECVEKSYPAFWNEYTRLGGRYEQYIG